MVRVLCGWLADRLESGGRLQKPEPLLEGAAPLRFFTDAKAEAGRAWIGGFLELVDGCQGPWFSLEVVDSWARWAFAKGDPGKVIAALELLATLVGVRLWVPDGDARKTSRVAIRGYTDNQSNESLLRFPYAEGNHFVTELRHEVMRDFGGSQPLRDNTAGGAPNLGGASHAMEGESYNDDVRKAAGQNWGGCLSLSSASPAVEEVERAFLQGPDVGRGQHNCSCSASEAPTAPDLQDVALAFAQGTLGLPGTRGGQSFYKANTIMNYPSIELTLPIPRSPYAEGDGSPSTVAPSSASVSGGGQSSCNDESTQDTAAGLEVECDEFQEINKTREGQKIVYAASPFPLASWLKEENEDVVCAASLSSPASWSKEEHEEPERPHPSPNPPLARPGLPLVAARNECHGKGDFSWGGQIDHVFGGFIWEDAHDAGSHGRPMQNDIAIHGVGSPGGQSDDVYGSFIWEDATDAGSHGMPLQSDDTTCGHCAEAQSVCLTWRPGLPSRAPWTFGERGQWRIKFGVDLSSLLGQDFSASIRKFIEQAVHKAIQDALQGMSLGNIGETVQEQPGPKRRKRQHERANAPAPSNEPSAPHDEASKPTKGPGKGGKKGTDATVPPSAAGKGRGQEGGHKGKGKGPKGSAIKPPTPDSGNEGDEWTTVSRQKPQGPWQLRDADWSAPTFSFDDVAEAIEKATGVFRAVVLCGPEQADLLATVLLGSKKPHGVIAVTPDHPEASARCPGAVGNSCVFKQVQFHHISSAGVELPSPKVLATKAPKVVASKTAVMYVRVYKKYVAKNAWKDILANPQRAFHHWIAQQHVKVQDSWGWAKEQTQGEDSKIYALFRVPEADVAAFAALSGREGFFIDPPRWTTFPAFSVQWAEKEVKETDLEFLQRVRAVESKFGVVVGRRGLGKRVARDANQVAQAASQDNAEEVPATDASMEASSKQAPSEGKEAKRESTSKGKGVAKRVCTETRDLPKGVEQQQAPTDGSCLFHAASAAIAHILKCEPEAHSVLRAKVVQHFKKNSSRYEAMWDKELPDRSQGNNFQDYISAIAVVDTWAGPMELAALGRIYDIKFVIYPRSPDLEVCAVHVNQRKRVAALAFTGSHYEWLKPVSKLPQELCDVTTPPPQATPSLMPSEADVNVASAPGYIRAWCAAGLFEFLCDEEVCQFVIASFYGQSGNAPAAAAQAEDVLAACSHSNLPFIVAGDFNLEPNESILGETRATGAVKSLDDASCGAPLPATGPGRKRRIDHGLCHWSVAASAILHFDPHFSDHASVCYEIPLDVPPFHVGPRRRPMNRDTNDVIADRFSQVDCAPFREALAQGNVDNAWCILSDWAEDCLTTNDTEAQEDRLSVLSDFVSAELPRHQAQEAAAVKAQWKQLLRDDINRQRTFVKAGSLYKMPLAWWAMAAELWSHVWSNADVPKAWKYAKVTLIRKKGGPSTRPITLTQIMWRIGAKCVAGALRQWAPEWASESDHGGLPGRSISDVLFQVQASLHRGASTAALMDVAGYFDAMNATENLYPLGCAYAVGSSFGVLLFWSLPVLLL
ncbi:OTUD4 [Symbiodinium sp. KB8]|nr:OTUD4 [Symbiodinium sp. KB8]